MKKVILISTLLCITGAIGFAQCDTKITLTSSATEYLDSGNTVQRTVQEKTTIKIDKSAFTIDPGGDHVMTGTIKSDTCNWKVPYKEGKSVIKALLSDPQGDAKNTTMTIEGKSGKVTLLFELAETPDKKIRVAIDTFEETK